MEVFEVNPSSKVAIASHSHVYVTVIFKPTAMQVEMCYSVHVTYYKYIASELIHYKSIYRF